jgi:hypothetical protein
LVFRQAAAACASRLRFSERMRSVRLSPHGHPPARLFPEARRTAQHYGGRCRADVTQPTLTKSIHLLEQDLGVRLFERLPRGVELTLYGLSLVRHAQAVCVQLAEAVGELKGLKSGADGQVTIGAGPARAT